MKFLVSTLLIVAAGAVSAQPCDIAADYANYIQIQEGDIHVGFATDKLVYAPGDPILFYLVVENTGTEQWHLNWGVDPQNAFFVTADSCTSINQPGCYDNAAYIFPQTVYYFSQGTTLDPGECRLWTHTTTYDPFYPAPSDGTYHVFGGMCKSSYTGDPLDWQVPADGLMLTITVDSSIATEESTWGRIKALYRR